MKLSTLTLSIAALSMSACSTIPSSGQSSGYVVKANNVDVKKAFDKRGILIGAGLIVGGVAAYSILNKPKKEKSNYTNGVYCPNGLPPQYCAQ